MRQTTKNYFKMSLVATLLALAHPVNVATASDIDTRGLAEPPFLAMGADSNLLMLLDNSGSMLDMAYVKDVGSCVDNSYDPTTEYAGLFNAESWYIWVEGTPQWFTGTIYSTGDFVFSEGIFYKATSDTGAASTGYRIEDDTEVTWEPVYELAYWNQGDVYNAKSFVQVDGQLYYTVAGGTANDPDNTDGISIDGDTGVTWEKVDSTLVDGETYVAGDVISYDSKLFYATAGITNTTSTFWDEVAAGTWKRLDEGHFEEVSGWTDVTDATTKYAALAGTDYAQDDLFVKIVDDGGINSGVTAFAATGNILNWASASKFDIQKDVLTGGKYDEQTQKLIAQSRGCSSNNFIREIEVKDNSANVFVLTFAIEGAQDDTRVDTRDETTRIVIRGLSASGFIGSAREQACQDAIDSIVAGYDDGLGTTKKNVGICLDYGGTNNVLAESNAAYNHSLHTCWQMSTNPTKYNSPYALGNVNEVINACEHIYDNGVFPSTIIPDDSGYVCFGVYNAGLQDVITTDTDGKSDRGGYVGRCWETGALPLDCNPTPCGGPLGAKEKCFPDNYVYECQGNISKKDGSCNKAWNLVLMDNGDGDADICDTSAAIPPGMWTDDVNPSTDTQCVQEALWNYCQDVAVPQVIDPSDETFETGQTLGMVGALIDAGVTSMFETDHALIVMKGYIDQPTSPEGLIHEYSSVLRMGAMAFRENGAGTECVGVDVNDMVDEYCPADAKDGAELIAPIKLGTLVTDDNGTPADSTDDILHMDDLAAAINDVRATAWTPLAEAYYTALGYYGQDATRRLFDGDAATTADFLTEAEGGADDPIEYWCQSNFILIISEGASTADISAEIMNFVDADLPAFVGATDTAADTNVDAECKAADDSSILYGSTYLDDLTYFAQNGDVVDIYVTPQMQDEDGEWYDKQKISTFIVTTGSLRDDGTTSECNPKTFMENAATNGGSTLVAGERPEDLEANLLEIFKSIRQRASAGSAASVVSSSRGGEGAVYQAIFWPELTRDDDANETHVVEWAGDVRALFIDSNGYLFDDSAAPFRTLSTEDLNGNGYLDTGEDANNNGTLDGDRRVIVYYDSIAKKSKACYNESIYDHGTCDNGDDLENVAFLWSAGQWLTTLTDTENQRTDHISNDLERRIYTWNDLDNDGVVGQREWLNFVTDDTVTDWSSLNGLVASNRSSIYSDFDVDRATEAEELAKIKDIISWVRGRDRLVAEDIDSDAATADEPAQRSRYIPESDGSAIGVTWRLGDVIYSTPMAVSSPAEGYHLLYNDYSYAQFLDKWQRRRHVIYYGANDGMLHAVNGGFYMDTDKQFCLNLSAADASVCDDSGPGNWPELGAELWAYVPYNMLPHLRGLTETDYKHKYFVDLRPRIFDAQIFEPDSDHVNGWGTILVGGMRLGGAAINANELDGSEKNDGREFISSYFILDITNPEIEPVLLAELTRFSQEPYVDANNNGTWDAGETYEDLNHDGAWTEEETYYGDANNNGVVDLGEFNDTNGNGTWEEPAHVDMGHSTNIATMVIMKEDGGAPNTANNQWYLLLGSGPHGSDAMRGVSDQAGKVAVIPLDWVVDTANSPGKIAMRIPNEDPTVASDYGGRFLLPDLPAKPASEKAFVSDAVTIDFDINPSTRDYMADVVYFGTVEGEFITDLHGDDNWTGGGKFHRLITRDTYDYGPGITQSVTTPDTWHMTVMMDVDRPVTTAPSVGFDGYNFWFYAGTGRYFDADDKHDDTQHAYFGIKEPMEPSGDHYRFIWPVSPNQAPIPAPDLDGNLARPDIPSQFPDAGATPGSKGLLRVDEIEVLESTHISVADIGCDPANDGAVGESCLPAAIQTATLGRQSTLGVLEEYIAGQAGAGAPSYSQSSDGWYKEFYPEHSDRQRNLGQPTLLGGLLLFTTYQPYEGVCQAEGLSYLYGVYYITGTSWHETIYDKYSVDIYGNVENQLFLGQGLAETPNLFVGQGSEGEMSAYVQTSTGEVKGIDIENVPAKDYFTGRARWKNCGP